MQFSLIIKKATGYCWQVHGYKQANIPWRRYSGIILYEITWLNFHIQSWLVCPRDLIRTTIFYPLIVFRLETIARYLSYTFPLSPLAPLVLRPSLHSQFLIGVLSSFSWVQSLSMPRWLIRKGILKEIINENVLWNFCSFWQFDEWVFVKVFAEIYFLLVYFYGRIWLNASRFGF